MKLYKLERLTMEHKDLRYEAVRGSLDHLKPWFPWVHSDYSMQENIKSIEYFNNNSRDICFVIFAENSGKYLGEVKLLNIEKGYYQCDAALSYWLIESYTRQKIMTNVVKEILLYAFNELKLRRVEVLVDIRNTVSQKFIEQLGGDFEGVQKSKWHYNNTDFDVKLYAFIANEKLCSKNL